VRGFLVSPQRTLEVDSDPNTKVVLIKTPPLPHFKNEIEALELCQGHQSIRPLVDVIDDPQLLVLEFLDKTLYDVSCEKTLEWRDIKRAVKTALDGLAILHAH
jgi:hypothetical protein